MEIMKTFSFEQRMVHHLILKSPFINDLGLFHREDGNRSVLFRIWPIYRL